MHSDLPKLISVNQRMKKSGEGNAAGYAADTGSTVTVMATHHIRPGKEGEFEAGEIETMTKLKESPGMIGIQILKRIGLSTLGGGHATVESMMEDLKDSPGTKLQRTAEVWEGYTLPAKYLVMVEWESLAHTQGNMPHVNVKPELLFIHGPKVLNNCLTYERYCRIPRQSSLPSLAGLSSASLQSSSAPFTSRFFPCARYRS